MNQNSHKFILSAVGHDQPGIAASVTKVLFDHQCNIEGSSMTMLQGEFAIILVLSSSSISNQKQLLEILTDELSDWNLMFNVRSHVDRSDSMDDFYYIMCSVYGADQPGIVYSVTNLLFEKKISITDLNTNRITSGDTPGYVMFIEAVCPKNISPDQIQKDFTDLSNRLNVQINVKELESESL